MNLSSAVVLLFEYFFRPSPLDILRKAEATRRIAKLKVEAISSIIYNSAEKDTEKISEIERLLTR